ncbi:hypothetical protein SAICODRAFT_20728 [Saitoella complicata NRRL Y-17804]|uniref:uncharacterized protein n=1 Tax=Saitoella complicata (strain BCRC 22490 / CBS 7301 / JCM 7358 / NBRC 10748 / NRRL Y-17804) TaxID=698492 RepID=UPI000866D16D|nr:uncharacterized protein SAICODRAFT_20728 [Saitoella complicata NRRL Y-17804]ODQ51361.1 hypothetical protein SAICODRAFT_20728 [Saitoella complicata NRRL Y-17804]
MSGAKHIKNIGAGAYRKSLELRQHGHLPTTQELHGSFQKLIMHYPVDRLRKHVSFPATLEAMARDAFMNPVELEEGEYEAAVAEGNMKKLDGSLMKVEWKTLGAQEIMKLEGQFFALEKLFGNEAKKKYPLSDKLLKPPFKPNYYEMILELVEKTIEDPKKAYRSRWLPYLTWSWNKP